jgi:hypothetical protein
MHLHWGRLSHHSLRTQEYGDLHDKSFRISSVMLEHQAHTTTGRGKQVTRLPVLSAVLEPHIKRGRFAKRLSLLKSKLILLMWVLVM